MTSYPQIEIDINVKKYTFQTVTVPQIESASPKDLHCREGLGVGIAPVRILNLSAWAQVCCKEKLGPLLTVLLQHRRNLCPLKTALCHLERAKMLQLIVSEKN